MHEYEKYNKLIEIRNHILSGKSLFDLKLRVTFYARVSSDSEEQSSSVINQVDYFTSMIKGYPNWTFVEGYIDEGISGKNVNKREDFLRMILDAKSDRFDLVLTKSVPRFARNTLDSIKYTEELLKFGIGVYFLNDNINTILPDSEFRLTLMASIAQDDLRKLSENVKFGLKQSIKRGVVLGANNIFGYEKDKGTLKIVEEEADVVRKIYNLYDAYSSLKKTSVELERLGHFNRKEKPFDGTTIRRIIMNPKYKGYYCGGKSTVIDYKTGKRKTITNENWVMHEDNGKVPPIVSEELWNKVNKELEKKQIGYKNNQRLTVRSNFTYSGKLLCKEHNVAYTRSGVKKERVNDYRYWSCRLYKKGKEYCDSPLLKESELDFIFKDIIKMFLKNKSNILDSLINRIKNYDKDADATQKISFLNKEVILLESKKEKLLELVMNNYLSNEEFANQNKNMNTKLNNLQLQINDIKIKKSKSDNYDEQLSLLFNSLQSEVDVEQNLTGLMDLLIDKVYVSKIDNDRTSVNMDIIFKINKKSTIIYDTKLPVLSQAIKLPEDTIKFVFDELKYFPATDYNLNSCFTPTKSYLDIAG